MRSYLKPWNLLNGGTVAFFVFYRLTVMHQALLCGQTSMRYIALSRWIFSQQKDTSSCPGAFVLLLAKNSKSADIFDQIDAIRCMPVRPHQISLTNHLICWNACFILTLFFYSWVFKRLHQLFSSNDFNLFHDFVSSFILYISITKALNKLKSYAKRV